MAADREVLKDFMDEVNRQNVKYDPLTGEALYYGDSGYDQGVSDSDWQTANSQYTTARENYAKSLIAKEYDNYLFCNIKSQFHWVSPQKIIVLFCFALS